MMASKLSVGNKKRADRINSLWDDTISGAVKGFIAVGDELEDAHRNLSAVDYADMIEHRLRFGARTAERLRAVAKDPRLATHVSFLPPHWSTLYEISRLDDSQFELALANGTIRSDMERKDVPRKRKESPVPVGSGIAVSAESSGETPPLAAAFGTTPHDDREGGDSVVTEHGDSGESSSLIERNEPERLFDAPDSGTPQGITDPERAAADDPEAGALEPVEATKVLGSSGEANARLAAAAEPQGEPDRACQENPVDAGEAGGIPAIYSDDPPGLTAFLVRGSDSISMLVNGLAMAITAIRDKRFSPAAAVEQFPQEMSALVPADDVTTLLQWMYRFDKLYRDRYGDDATRAAE